MKSINPQDIHIKDYNYSLPDDKIAKYPLSKRDDSKLLIYQNNQIVDSKFSQITSHLPNNSLIIFNNTKVIQARMHFEKTTGAKIEIFCLDPYTPHDYAQIFETRLSCKWQCMIGNAKKWKDDSLYKTIVIDNNTIQIIASKVQSTESNNSQIVQFEWNNENYTFAEILEKAGELPIPPYLNRDTDESDLERYQTLYSKIKGSVAAPTAGLHFTTDTMSNIIKSGCKIDEVTLHVGAGTFKPVKSETIKEHEMHSEFITVRKNTIEEILKHEGKIIAVGTTSVRTLESLYHIGCMIEENHNLKQLVVDQWQPYMKTAKKISKKRALNNIVLYLENHKKDVLFANTRIMIVPGYEFMIVNGIITNFHQPQSTLLLLVSAFVKGNWKTIYNHALTHEYRFLSYGDSSLLL